TPRMNAGDVGYLFRYAGTEPLARAQLWDWYMAHYRPLAARISSEGMLVVPSLFDEACSSAARKQLADFFIPRLKTIPGLSRTLALTEQRIDQCISLRDSKGTSIRAALLAAGR
ncbi:MAG: hypothetical protein KGO02_17965, partial [Alphaproteobacteria bacterium]|nr:hypothetical protein [Alphaproteobacteria bacterium]